jgi:hypothetical protein
MFFEEHYWGALLVKARKKKRRMRLCQNYLPRRGARACGITYFWPRAEIRTEWPKPEHLLRVTGRYRRHGNDREPALEAHLCPFILVCQDDATWLQPVKDD